MPCPPRGPMAFARRHPTLLIVGSIASWIPVGIYMTSHVGQLMWINGPSMYPFLNTDYNSTRRQDVVYVDLWAPLRDMQRGSVVAFWSPSNPERLAVKRVIALEGDEVRTQRSYPFPSEVVPVGHVWVEGENPDDLKTMDSNTYGPVSKNLIVGKVKAIVYPWPKMGLIRWQDYKGSPRVTPNKVHIIPMVKG